MPSARIPNQLVRGKVAYKSHAFRGAGKEAGISIDIVPGARRGETGSQDQEQGVWLGFWEYRFLKYLMENGLVVFRLSHVNVEGLSPRRKYDVAKRLLARGILEKLRYGLYKVVANLAELLAVAKVKDTRGAYKVAYKSSGKEGGKEAQGTRVVGMAGAAGVSAMSKVSGVSNVSGGNGGGVSGGLRVLGQFFDNVRGYTASGGRYVGGDRGRVVSWRHFSLFGSVSYAEVGWWVGGTVLDGRVVVYTNSLDLARLGECVRVEWRPPEGYVKRHGLDGAVRKAREEVLKAWKALTVLVARFAAEDLSALREAVAFLRSSPLFRLAAAPAR